MLYKDFPLSIPVCKNIYKTHMPRWEPIKLGLKMTLSGW
jgi:hypothetical protein